MGYQTCALFIHMDRPSDLPSLLRELGVIEDGEVGDDVDYFTATSSADFDQVYVGAAEGWTIVSGMGVMFAHGQQEYSRTATVVEMTLSGASSTYQFAVYKDGAELRAFAEQEGEVTHSRGAPLPEETDLDGYDYTEARVLEIVQRCTIPISAYGDIAFTCVSGQPNYG